MTDQGERDDIPDLCRKRRPRVIRRFFGERDDLAEVCEQLEDGYCPGCHSRFY